MAKRIPWVWLVTSSKMCGIACGKYLGQWAPPVFWNLLSEQVQNKYLGKVCCYSVNSRQAQVTEMCWPMPSDPCSTFFSTSRGWQSGSDGKVLGIAATPTPVTGTRDPTHASVSHPTDKKWTRKSANLVKGDKVGPSQEKEEEAEQKVTTTQYTYHWVMDYGKRFHLLSRWTHHHLAAKILG